MNNSFPRLIDGMVATLHDSVLPNLKGDFVRGQVYGIVYILNQMKIRGDWSVTFLLEQITAQEAMFAELERLAADLPVHPPAFVHPALSEPVAAHKLEALRNEGNQCIGSILTWLREHREVIKSDKADAIDRVIRDYLLLEIRIEMKNTARSLFAEMSQNTEG